MGALTPEGKVKEKIKKLLKKLDVYYFMPVASVYSKRGVPDIICCVTGTFVGIEVKATSKQVPTQLQLIEHERIKKAGGFMFVVNADNFDDFTINFSQLVYTLSVIETAHYDV